MRVNRLQSTRLLAVTVMAFSWLVSSQAHAEVTIGLKNFRQVLDSLVVITGITPDDDINNYYNTAMTRFPKTGAVEEMTSPMLLALSTLSAMFCQKMIAADSKITDPTKRRANSKVDFSKGPSSVNDNIKKSVINEYSNLFWSRNATDVEQAAILDSMSKIASNSTNSTSGTQDLLTLTCSQVATSLDFIIN